MPSADTWITNFLSTRKGDRLRYAYKGPPHKECRAGVVMLNGRTEYIEKYSYLADDLELPEDCAYLCWDHHGQGASSGHSGHIDHYDTYADDAADVITHQLGSELPYMAIAHSMGCLIALYGVISGRLRPPKKLVLSAPLLALPDKPLPPSIAKPASRLFSACGLAKLRHSNATIRDIPFAENVLTHSAERYEDLRNNQYQTPMPTFGWVDATFRALDVVFDEQALRKAPKVPVTILAPELERIVNPNGFYHWANLAGQAGWDIHLQELKGSYHEVLFEEPAIYREALALTRRNLQSILLQ